MTVGIITHLGIKRITVFPQKILNCLPGFWTNFASIKRLDFLLDASFGKKAAFIHNNTQSFTL